MFRLPTHLESLVPPPRDQVPHSQPWRGAIFLPASSPHPAPRTREIRVTAAETENDSQQESWPKQFHLHILGRRGVLREVHNWLLQLQQDAAVQQPPRRILMPDRLSDQAASQQNQAMFEAFARQLLEEETVAIAQWSASEAASHGGILLYPTTTTSALLVGIVFLNAGFPDFIQSAISHSVIADTPFPSHHVSYIPRSQPFQHIALHSPFTPAPPNIASSSRYPGAFDPSKGRSGRNSG